MRNPLPVLAFALSCAVPAFAATSAATTFHHKEWSLVCDNTRTCRAAGYQAIDNEDNPVSVLLTRKAGPGEPVTVQLKLLPVDELSAGEPRQRVLRAAMTIGDRALGAVDVDRGTWTGTLSRGQADALLAALAGSAPVYWSSGTRLWELSSAGATAVLLKMDEVQGRLGTTGALVRKGSRPDSAALPPLPPPVVTVPSLPANPSVSLPAAHKAALLPLLKASLGPEDCPALHDEEDDDENGSWSVTRLSNGKLLVGALCDRAAYNETFAWWLLGERPPYAPQLLPADGNIYRNGTIIMHRKGRGIGDCWEHEEWTWDGRAFVTTLASDGGPCRMAPGGWDMPSFVSTVRHADK